MLAPLLRVWASGSHRSRRRRSVSLRVESLEDRCLLTLFPAVLPLNRLNGTTGFALTGGIDNGQAGAAVSSAGDVNGDGLADFLIGAPGPRNAGGAASAGKAYVVFGKTTGFPANLKLNTLNGTNGFMIRGIAAKDRAGYSVAGAGDINGDDIDDLIIGARNAGTTDKGAAYVIFGRNTPFAATLALSSLDGSTGFSITGAADGDRAGASVSGVGDVNGDDIDDVIIGAPGDSQYGPGHAYVVFGKLTAFAPNLNLGSLGAAGVVLNGYAGDSAGSSVKGAGDVNGDGLDDMIVSAYAAGGLYGYGSAYVVFGRSTAFPTALNLDDVNGTTGFRMDGVGFLDFAGAVVSGAGDVNGDGFDDLLVGAAAVGFPPFSGEGFRSQVVFGKSGGFTPVLDLASLDGDNGFTIHRVPGAFQSDKGGMSLSAAGDVNGDGIDDILIGVTVDGDKFRGQSHVLFGKTTPFSSDVQLSDLNGADGFTLPGVKIGDRAINVAGAGDVNGDGIDDLLIGAAYADPGGTDRGKAYVVFGRRDLPTVLATGPNKGQPPLVRVFDTFRSESYTLTPYAANFTGGVRVAVGDVNNDGTADIITAPGKGIATQVKVFDGVTHLELGSFANVFPYLNTYTQGAFVAAADIDGLPGAEVIVGPGQGGPANPVKVFKADGTEIVLNAAAQFPYGVNYTGGVRVAAGNIEGSAVAEIVTARTSGASNVAVFDAAGNELRRIKAYTAAGGNFVALADLDGDGLGEIITGPEGNQKPMVRIFDGATGLREAQFLAFPGTFRGGVRVGALDVNGDGRMDILGGGGKGGIVKAFDRLTRRELDSFFAYASPHDGVFLAGG